MKNNRDKKYLEETPLSKLLYSLSMPAFVGMIVMAVGEAKEEMHRITKISADILPQNKPRYLMGVGTPQDILESIDRGIDMFDCVMPTRNARNGTVFTSNGKLVIKAARFKHDQKPVLFGQLFPFKSK